MIIVALVVGWLFLGFCGGVLLWFFAEREFNPGTSELKVRASDLWMLGILTASGPISLIVTVIHVLLALMDRAGRTEEPERVIFTFTRKSK